MPQRVQVNIPRMTGLPEDVVTNTFHFRTPTGAKFTAGEFPQVYNAIQRFYGVAAPPSTSSIGSILANLLNTGAVSLKFYDLADLPPRIPYHTQLISFNKSSATDSLPEETAVALSIKKNPVSGQDPRNMRGRLFIGPLTAGAAVTQSNKVRFDTELRGRLVNAAARLKTEINAIGAGFAWVIYSPTNNEIYDVEAGWVDDAFDTIRSRGGAATTRTTFTF